MKFLRPSLLLALLGLALATPAQDDRRPRELTPAQRAYLDAQHAILVDGDAILRKAAGALGANDLKQAETLAVRALDRFHQMDQPIDYSAHALLAEIYVAMERYEAALSEAKQSWPDGKRPSYSDVRSAATESLALIGLGRLEEARPLLARASTDGSLFSYMLGGPDDLPCAGDPSARALAATAHLLRGASYGENTRHDLEESLRLAPGNPVALLSVAALRRRQGRLAEARALIDSVRGGGEATRKALRDENRKLRWDEAHPKTDG